MSRLYHQSKTLLDIARSDNYFFLGNVQERLVGVYAIIRCMASTPTSPLDVILLNSRLTLVTNVSTNIVQFSSNTIRTGITFSLRTMDMPEISNISLHIIMYAVKNYGPLCISTSYLCIDATLYLLNFWRKLQKIAGSSMLSRSTS